jgi:hypothetical protein
MEKKFDIIELEIDWESTGPSVSRPIPRAPAVPASATNEAVQEEPERVVAPGASAQSAPVSPSGDEENRVPAQVAASVVSKDVEAEPESATLPAEDEGEAAELEELQDLEEVEELDDSFLEPADGAPELPPGQNEPDEPV